MTDAQAKLKRWRANPVAFVTEELHADPDPWQREALEVFPSQKRDEIRISLQACVGPGKTTVLAWMGWNFLACYGERGEHPKGAAVSVDWPNLKGNLWPELSKWQNRSEFLKRAFRWTAHRISAIDHPETWFLDARSWPKTADPEQLGKTLSGLHSKYVLALIDESGTIPLPILKAADQALSACIFGKIVQAGNPSSLEGMLYIAATTQRHLWHVIRITGDPDDPRRSPRIDKAWAQEQIALYGREDPWVMYSILGQFPPASINSFLSITEVEAAMDKHFRIDQFDWAQKRLGIDAAWRGDDKWVIFPRQGLAAFQPVAMRNPKTEEIGSRIIAAKLKFGSEREYFDDTGGFAAGASDFYEAAGYTAVRVDFSGRPQDPRYYNRRAEMWWRGTQAIKHGAGLPPVRELVAELTVPTYTYVKGKLKVEDKDRIKERLKRSPDYADGYMLTYAEEEMPRELANQLQAAHRASMEWDPHRQEETVGARTEFDPHRDRI